MKKLIIGLFVLCQIIGCKESRQYKYVIIDSFPDIRKLHGEIIKTINPLSLSNMIIIDTLMVIINRTDNSLIQVYSTVSYDLLGEFSHSGRGPGEFLSPVFIPQTSCRKDDLIKIFDASGQNITKIKLHESIEKSEYMYDRISFDHSDDNDHYKNVFYYDEEMIFYENVMSDYRISIYNKILESSTYIPYGYPDPGFTISPEQQYHIYASKIIINPVLGRIAAAPVMIGQIELFDFNGNHIVTSVFDDDEDFGKKMSEWHANRIPDLKLYVTDIEAYGDYIYALNVNLPYSQINDMNAPPSEILVFNWDGMPIEKIILDNFVTSVAIDFKHSKIYGFCPYEMDYTIVCYDLSPTVNN